MRMQSLKMSFEEVWPDFPPVETVLFPRGIVAAVHPFPEMWTRPNLGRGSGDGGLGGS